MAFTDLREWIEALESEGELKRITVPVNWNLELGAITRKVLSEGGPALLFENVAGYQSGRCTRFFTGGVGNYRRLAMMMGLPRGSSKADLVRETRARLSGTIESKVVKTGPVKENIIRYPDIDLLEFPVPRWHHLDGGRYINTWCGVVTRDPRNGRLNVGTYRGMINSKDAIGVLLVPAKHWGGHALEYQKVGMEMPVAVVYGWDPAMNFMAVTPVLANCSEWDVIGSIRQRPVELVKCETSDLLVPATAEVVVEGTVSLNPNTFELEGPFGEYTGYYGGKKSPKPRIKVACITHRNNPILRGALEGTSPGKLNETSRSTAVSYSAIAWQLLDLVGVPGVTNVWVPEMGVTANIRVQIHKMYRGHAKQVAAALWGFGGAQESFKNVFVFDEDIDIYDNDAVEWAIAYRVNAGENDIVVYPGNFGSPLDPSTRVEDRDVRKYGAGKWNRVLIDATINWEYEKQKEWGDSRYPPLATTISQEEEALVTRRWAEYGLDSI